LLFSNPIPNADVDAPDDPEDPDDASCYSVRFLLREVYRCVHLNDTYIVVAHEYMAPSELSKLTLDELKA
jgi:hypothetical protein